MPKLKTNRSARKRFRARKTDIKRKNAGRSHLLSVKSRKRKRRLRKGGVVCKAELKRVKRLIPYQKI